jgi:hypothetical protein
MLAVSIDWALCKASVKVTFSNWFFQKEIWRSLAVLIAIMPNKIIAKMSQEQKKIA